MNDISGDSCKIKTRFALMKSNKGEPDVIINTYPFTIGRSRTADFIIEHLNISRNHCDIVFENFSWKITDFSSSGTYVNDALVGKGRSIILGKGDVIRLGPAESDFYWTFHPLCDSVQSANGKDPFKFDFISQQCQVVLKLCNEKCNLFEKINSNKKLYLKLESKKNKLEQDYKELSEDLKESASMKSPPVPTNSSNGEKKKAFEEMEKQLLNYQEKIAENKLMESKYILQVEMLQKQMEIEMLRWNSKFMEEKKELEEKISEKDVKITGHLEIDSKKEEFKMKIIEQEEKKMLIKKLFDMEEMQKLLADKLHETNQKTYINGITVLEENNIKTEIQHHIGPSGKVEKELNKAVCLGTPKNESDRNQDLRKELEKVKSALTNLEDKNSDLLENLTDVMETELQCTICSELFVVAMTLSCTHTFCKFCINQWKKKQKTCPICRKKITNETRSLVLDNYIDKMVGKLSVELKERRKAIISERNEPVPMKKSRTKRN